jgi:hypothetical protein
MEGAVHKNAKSKRRDHDLSLGREHLWCVEKASPRTIYQVKRILCVFAGETSTPVCQEQGRCLSFYSKCPCLSAIMFLQHAVARTGHSLRELYFAFFIYADCCDCSCCLSVRAMLCAYVSINDIHEALKKGRFYARLCMHPSARKLNLKGQRLQALSKCW